jgi:hypothetical protein
METEDMRIVLRGDQAGEESEQIVEHQGQPADYVHADGTLWTWKGRVRPVGGVQDDRGGRIGGVHLRVYDLVTPDADSG